MKVFNKGIIKLILLRRILKRKKQKRQPTREIFWNRHISGERFLVKELQNDPLYHHKYFRMKKENFDDILTKIGTDIQGEKKNARPISSLEKLAATIRFLASGSSQIQIALNYRISPSSMGRILRETMIALCHRLEADYLPRPNEDIWKASESRFKRVWNFPNCCGAIDGKHIRVKAPDRTGSLHFNYKGYFSIVLMAIADASYKFIAVDIGAVGSLSDGGVLSRSALGQELSSNNLSIPPPKLVENGELPYVLVGDDAFPLKHYLMKPFGGKQLSKERRIFNYRLSRARMVIENAFGILSSRWRILLSTIHADIEFTKLIVKTCVILHNYLISNKDFNDITTDNANCNEPNTGNWRQNESLRSVAQQGSNNFTTTAGDIREFFMNYFNTTGQVPWQENMI